jgi:hypothetical protein
MRKILSGLLIALLLTVVCVIPALADAENVTVTAAPSYINISSSPNTWTVNGVNGDGTMDINTTYYACSDALSDDVTSPGATVVDNDCYFTCTDTSSVKVDIVVTFSDFSSGSDPMVNSNAGTNGAGTYGAYAYYSGMTYSNKKIAKTTGSDIMYTSSAAGDFDKKWAVSILTQTDDWTGSSASTATLTITATKH